KRDRIRKARFDYPTKIGQRRHGRTGFGLSTIGMASEGTIPPALEAHGGNPQGIVYPKIYRRSRPVPTQGIGNSLPLRTARSPTNGEPQASMQAIPYSLFPSMSCLNGSGSSK